MNLSNLVSPKYEETMNDDGWVKVLIEPSLLVDKFTLDRVIENIQQPTFRRSYQFFVPSKFIYIIREVEPNIENILFFSRSSKNLVDLKYLRNILEKLEKEQSIQKFEIMEDYKHKFDDFYKNLLSKTKNDVITEILFEEWIFLQERSLIISKIKKPFNYFIKAGAVSIEFSRRTLDSVVAKTLKKEDKSILTNVDRLRALGKWIAVGGPLVLSLVHPIATAIGNAVTRYFLLIDP